jgi:hypothetical protein
MRSKKPESQVMQSVVRRKTRVSGEQQAGVRSLGVISSEL